MIMKRMTSNPSEQLKAALEWCDKFEDTSRREIMVDKDVYFNAEKISKKLNTKVDGVFCLCAYRILIALHRLLITYCLRDDMRSR